ncbi:ParB/RepB/Spo0J family partition protein [Streptomyces sp. NPDC002125]
MTKSEQFAQSSAFNRAGGARSARRELFDAATGKKPAPTELSIRSISQNPDNPRDHLRDLTDMTQSVEQVGVVNAITVATISAYLEERPDRAEALDPDTTYIVVDGHRRLEAARRAGLDTIKVTVDDALVSTDETLLEAAFVANYHRDNMTELEEALALEKLVQFYGTQAKASKRLGMAQATISSKLSFLKLAPDLQADLAEGRRPAEHVRNLGKLSPEEQRARADERAREAQQRTKQAAPPASAKRTPAAEKDPATDYHAVIIETPKATDDSAQQDAPLPEPRRTKPAEPQATEVPKAKPPGDAWELPPGGWEPVRDILLAQMGEFDRHMLTRSLVKVMDRELGRTPADTTGAS